MRKLIAATVLVLSLYNTLLAGTSTVYENQFSSYEDLNGTIVLDTGQESVSILDGHLKFNLSTAFNTWANFIIDYDSFSSSYHPKLDENDGLVTWSFNVSNKDWYRNNGFWFIMICTSNNPRSQEARGYMFKGGIMVGDRMGLWRFDNGIGGHSEVLVDVTDGLGPLPEKGSIKVTYDPSTKEWSLYGVSHLGYVDARLVDNLIGTAIDDTYTSLETPYLVISGANQGEDKFDNIFITVVDTTPPIITSTWPNDDASDVDVNVEINATFSEFMDASTVTSASFILTDGIINVSSVVTLSDDVVTLKPAEPLSFGTNYTATITTSAKDPGGNSLATAYTWSFTTDKAEFYYPHIASGNNWETEICIINKSSIKSLNADLKAYNKSGQEVDLKSIDLGPNSRREIIIGTEFHNANDIKYIILDSNHDEVFGYTKFYQENRYRAAVPASFYVNDGDIFIPHIVSNGMWWTGISILNTTSFSKEIIFNFNNGTEITKTLAPNEHQAFSIKNLFGGEAPQDVQSAVIKNGSGIIGVALFGSTVSSGKNYLSGVPLKDIITDNLCYPHIVNSSKWWTGIVAYNPSELICYLTILPFTHDGIQLSPQYVTLAGKSKFIGTINNLKLPVGTESLKIEASNPVTGFELFGTKDGNQMGGYSSMDIYGTNGTFSKIEKDGWTGIAFVNIDNSSANVTMKAFDDIGQEIASESLNLGSNEKVLGLPSKLFSENLSGATYITYSSDKNIIGFQLNGSSDDMKLDALPAN